MIRTLTDAIRGERGYGGDAVAITVGLELDDIKKDLAKPSREPTPSFAALFYYRKDFSSDQAFNAFVSDFVQAPTGTALNGRLAW